MPALHLKILARTLSTSPRPTSELFGTAPPHRCYIFLHTTHPPSEYPAKFTTPIHRTLLLRTAKWGASVNFAWSNEHPPAFPAQTEINQSSYHLTAFASPRGKLETTVSMDNIDQIAEQLRVHAAAPPLNLDSDGGGGDSDVHLYVCTHGARDCRCGNIGGAVAHAIVDELRRRRDADPSDPSTRIKLAQVAHVGGHKYAANLLVYPHGEWLGRVDPEHVPEILNAILMPPIRPLNGDDMPICPRHWRGRMGLTKDEQIQLYQQTCA